MWGNDVAWDRHDLRHFCSGFRGLGDVHVHFVTIKVGIIGGCDGEVEAECGVGEDTYTMALESFFGVAGVVVRESVCVGGWGL